jgi:hypothetical protein
MYLLHAISVLGTWDIELYKKQNICTYKAYILMKGQKISDEHYKSVNFIGI